MSIQVAYDGMCARIVRPKNERIRNPLKRRAVDKKIAEAENRIGNGRRKSCPACGKLAPCRRFCQ